eukprot:2267757-Alexandrium_andersonii.AAC.1
MRYEAGVGVGAGDFDISPRGRCRTTSGRRRPRSHGGWRHQGQEGQEGQERQQGQGQREAQGREGRQEWRREGQDQELRAAAAA